MSQCPKAAVLTRGQAPTGGMGMHPGRRELSAPGGSGLCRRAMHTWEVGIKGTVRTPPPWGGQPEPCRLGSPSLPTPIPHLGAAELQLSALGWQQWCRSNGGNGALSDVKSDIDKYHLSHCRPSCLRCCSWPGTAFRARLPAGGCCSPLRLQSLRTAVLKLPRGWVPRRLSGAAPAEAWPMQGFLSCNLPLII